ncbi:MAG TPA: SDR family oxidoreductase [Amycolatopsis sp.]|uniref:SDR family oxidoreductase n=1 Tax=Amycolatopsis sp. TaxID=37632 RepID=UPI002B469AF7|nr:SDR family oxidoreductase [Amycolatopsis sp.]HKS50178.1 SDR family oxidoreductase [Amycolatopsis sp.]
MILVTGATGSIGRDLVRRLTADGVLFKALVRRAEQGRELGCPFVVGDFDEPGSLATAFDGIDRLFLNSSGALPVRGEQPMVRHQRALIEAAQRAGLTKIVKISVWRAREGGKLAEGAHWHIEELLKKSGIDWSVLQPSGFMQNFVSGTGSFTEDGNLIGAYGDARVSYVDCHDIAACAAVLLTDPGNTGRSYVVTGPEALNHTEIAAKLTAAFGRPVRYVDLPPEQFAAKLTARGVPADFATDVAALYAEVAAGALEETTTAVEDLTGRRPRTFDEFLAEHSSRVSTS